MEENCKIIVSLTEGKIEISGSETFVSKQLGEFKEQIIAGLSQVTTKTKENSSANVTVSTAQSSNAKDKNLDDYPDIFTLDGDKIKIIPQMVGSTKAKKVVKLAVLYAYARKLQGFDSASVPEIKTECETHGLFDSNFSTNIKGGDPSYYIDKDSDSARIIRIIKPGEKYALDILKELNVN